MRFRAPIAITLLCIPPVISAQNPQARYQAAKILYAAHAQQFFHDSSPQAVQALIEMNTAAADAVVLTLSHNPNALSSDLEATLCHLDDSACKSNESSQSVAQIAPHLFVASHAYSEVGMVFVVGFHGAHPAILWSISSTPTQAADPHRLLAAWKPERAAESCRDHLNETRWATCGPLYASVGALPSDAQGFPRFYIDGNYAQSAGLTVAQQTSVWRWGHGTATPLWIHQSIAAMDRTVGTTFTAGILAIGEKSEYRSFCALDAGDGREMVRRVHITPTGVQDLGTRPAYPEIDLVDTLFRRLVSHRPTADIAAPEIAKLLDPQSQDLGSIESSSVIYDGAIARICLITDGTARLDFTLEKVAGKPRLTNVVQHRGDYNACPRPSESVGIP